MGRRSSGTEAHHESRSETLQHVQAGSVGANERVQDGAHAALFIQHTQAGAISTEHRVGCFTMVEFVKQRS